MELLNTIIIEINNREKSIILWTVLFFIWALSRKEIRSSFIDVLKAFFIPKIFVPLLMLSGYIIFIVWVLSKFGYWKIFLLKDTLIWFFGFAFILFFNSNKATEEDSFFKKVLIDNVKFFIIVQFVVNMYVFNLLAELIITPLLTILIGMSVVAENKEEYKIVHKVVNVILSTIGFIFVIFSFSKAFTDLNIFLTSVTFQKLVLPPILTFFLIPFIYLIALFMLYETIFIFLSFKEYYKNNLKHIKINLIVTCNLNLNKLKKFRATMHDFDLSTKEGITLAMESIKIK